MAWENRQGREVKEPNHVYKFFKKYNFDDFQCASLENITVNDGCMTALLAMKVDYGTYVLDFDSQYAALRICLTKDNKFYNSHRCV